MQLHFSKSLAQDDPAIFAALGRELYRQRNNIELIASENIASPAVIEALGSVATNKYAEGYPSRRYYGGCVHVDEMEVLAIERAKRMFGVEYVNVQPHSGSQANQTAFFALLNPGDSILGMSLSEGGHLTHGAHPNLSGRWFKAHHYGVDHGTSLINYDHVEELALMHRPKLIIAGSSAYPRAIDFARFRQICDRVGAYLMADIAHYAGLIVTNQYPSPAAYADVITSTTHKTLRGPRGGLVMSNNAELFKKLDSALFPGIQGGPLMNVIAAKAVAFNEALSEEFINYGACVLRNARTLAASLIARGYDVITGGTDCHIVLVNLTASRLTGKLAEQALGASGITCNKNTVPGETQSPFVTSGIRLGSAACTTRGLSDEDFMQIGNAIADVLDDLQHGTQTGAQRCRELVEKICARYPIYAQAS